MPRALRRAVEALAPLGAAPIGTEVSLDWNGVMIPGKTVRGVIAGDSVPDVFIPRLVELHLRGRFPVDRLIGYYDPYDINKADEDAESGDTL